MADRSRSRTAATSRAAPRGVGRAKGAATKGAATKGGAMKRGSTKGGAAKGGAAQGAPRKAARPLAVHILGAGKVGTLLARALRSRGAHVTLGPGRGPLPRRPIVADVLVIAVRDAYIEPLAASLAAAGRVDRATAVVHCAGALGPEALAPLRAVSAGVAQMHPMISFASKRALPSLERGQVHVDGDPIAVRRARAIARLLGMTPRTIPGLDRVIYHAAAGLVANGAAALAAGGQGLLVRAGVPARTAAAMLGPLLRSVAENVEILGLPEALTGPVRRGDAAGVRRHLETLRRAAPHLEPLYRAAGLAQLPLARALGDAPGAAFDEVEQALGAGAPRAGIIQPRSKPAAES